MSTQNNQDQSLEKSTRYIAGYLKFDLKKDLQEVIEPIYKHLEAIVNSIDGVSKRVDDVIDVWSEQSYDK